MQRTSAMKTRQRTLTGLTLTLPTLSIAGRETIAVGDGLKRYPGVTIRPGMAQCADLFDLAQLPAPGDYAQKKRGQVGATRFSRTVDLRHIP